MAPSTDALRKLHVEVTTGCNLDCDMCIRHTWSEPDAHMSEATFQAVVDGLQAFGRPVAIQLAGYGEPLTHPLLPKFVQLATDAGIATEIVTNAELLTPDLGLELLRAGMGRLIASLDGDGDAVSAMQSNLRRLFRVAVNEGILWPGLTLHTVLKRSTIDQLDRLRHAAMGLRADTISISHLLPHTSEMADEAMHGNRLPTASGREGAEATRYQPHVALPPIEWSPDEAAPVARLLAGITKLTLGRTEVDFGAGACPFIEDGRAAITWGGDLSPCLPLLHTHPVVTHRRSRTVTEWRIGNVNESPLRELWERPDYAAFRARVRDFAFPPCPNCGGCGLVETNQADCIGNPFPTCGDCLYARGLVRCP